MDNIILKEGKPLVYFQLCRHTTVFPYQKKIVIYLPHAEYNDLKKHLFDAK